MQRIGGMVAARIGAQDEDVLALGQSGKQRLFAGVGKSRIGRGRGRDPLDAHNGDAVATGDLEVLNPKRGRRLEEADEERALPRAAGRRVEIKNLQRVDAVQDRVRGNRLPAPLVAAEIDHDPPSLRSKVVDARAPVRVMT
jgi:hypothetical protein